MVTKLRKNNLSSQVFLLVSVVHLWCVFKGKFVEKHISINNELTKGVNNGLGQRSKGNS
jgi:hypothetical protein